MNRFRAQSRLFARLIALAELGCVLSFRSALAQNRSPILQGAEAIHGRIGVGAWRTQAEYKDIRVTKGGKTLYASDFSKGMDGWQIVRGQWQIVDGALRQTGGDEDTRVVYGDPKWSDYTLTLKARKLGGGEGFLVLFGVLDDKTKCWWNLGGWGNTLHAIEAPATPGERLPGKIETGRWYDIKIELKANTIRAYLDGKLLQTATQVPRKHTITFSTRSPGKKMALTHWGLDTAWPDPDHIQRGVRYMGKENVDVIRVSFPINEPLVDGDLPASKQSHFDTRLEMAKIAGDKPFSMLPDTEAGVNPWYKNGREIIPERWVQLMAAAQRHYGKKMESVEPFNEADYGWGQGSIQNLNDILGALRRSPDFDGVQMGGASTLSADAAKTWFDAIKNRLDRGTTHSLGGSFSSYINFYKQVAADGKILDNPEAHNLVEVISGAEYGLQSSIWWGTAELARGEFVKAVHGTRLAYAEDLARWNSAAVYRAPSGKVQAFLGASERMGDTSVYRFVCEDRTVFFNGDGPRREYSVPILKDNERVINITWGPDVPPKIGGRYVIVNRATGKVLGVTDSSMDNGAAIQQKGYTRAASQQWEVAPYVAQYGDQDYFTIHAAHSGKTLSAADRKYDEGGAIVQFGEGKDEIQQWYFDYTGDNCFTIRNRWTTMCLQPADGNDSAIVQTSPSGSRAQQWRLIPVGEIGKQSIDFIAPKAPAGIKASTQRRAVALHWAANREADLASYTVFRATSKGGPWDTIARDVRGTSYVDYGATEQRTYYYAVKAVDRSLNPSAFSAETSARPQKR